MEGSRLFLGGTEENGENSQSGFSVCRPRFELDVSRIQVRIKL
jgi:hypothetical protein